VSEKALDKMRGLGVEPGQSTESLRRQSSARQSRRFLIAALAAAAAGEDQQVQGYLSVLTRLQERGAPSIYWRTGRLLALKSARPIMRAVRTVRREFTRARVRCAAF
jgi:hypothetical protein